MLGWLIIVSTQTPDERDRATDPAVLAAGHLARWEVGAGGVDWLEQLVKNGKATCLKRGGYPTRYTAQASDVLPLIRSGAIEPPPGGFNGRVSRLEVYADRIAQCAPEKTLTIDAWDQS